MILKIWFKLNRNQVEGKCKLNLNSIGIELTEKMDWNGIEID